MMNKKERSYLNDKLNNLENDPESRLGKFVTSIEMEATIDPYFSDMSIIVDASRSLNSFYEPYP